MEMKFSSSYLTIDRGITTAELRENPLKYILSGRTREVVYCTGGEGLKLSREIVEEMARRGSAAAKRHLETGHFQKSKPYVYIEDPDDGKEWTWFDNARHSRTLIKIVKEGKLKNIGGWTLVVAEVPEEDWAWEIKQESDHYRSEYIVGAINDNVVCDSDSDYEAQAQDLVESGAHLGSAGATCPSDDGVTQLGRP
jgi:hypothetical protein